MRNRFTRPLVVDPAFGDPDLVLDLLRREAPYKHISGLNRSAAGYYGRGGALALFRAFWAGNGDLTLDRAAPIFSNPNFIAAAKSSFQTDIVRPLALIVNLTTPMPQGAAHTDNPYFRGASAPHFSLLRGCMGSSGLFRRWEVLAASVISWFYEGPGGGLDYWAEGPQQPPSTISTPLWNVGLVSDNEYMFHRVGPVGDPADYAPEGALTASSVLARIADSWEIQGPDGAPLAAYADGQVRISLLWKALVFDTPEAARLFDDRSDDLTPGMIVDIFRDDLARQGVSTPVPDDPLTDPVWTATLKRHYPVPSLEQAAD